jgi:hypothetical protein
MTKEDVRVGRLAMARSSLPTQLNLALALNRGLLDIEASICLTRSFSLLPQTRTEHRENFPKRVIVGYGILSPNVVSIVCFLRAALSMDVPMRIAC